MRRIRRVLLTGGIASGKTFISDYLAGLGAHVVDTDLISRSLTTPDNELGRAALQKIRDQFGGLIVDSDLILDRSALRELIFTYPERKAILESILHPRILAETIRQIEAVKDHYVLIVVPIMYEGSPYLELADEVLVVEVARELQIERVMSRDGSDRTLTEKIIAAQIPRLERRKFADKIIINNDREHVKRVLRRLHLEYLRAIEN